MTNVNVYWIYMQQCSWGGEGRSGATTPGSEVQEKLNIRNEKILISALNNILIIEPNRRKFNK
jgi:hypothetical protein